MAASIAADLVLLLHLGFIVFAMLGGLLTLKHPRLAWIHLPAVAWGMMIEVFDWVCPLTPLENQLRDRAGETAYAGGFVEHYLTSLIYPEGLTRPIQLALAAALLLLNLAIYAYVIHRSRHPR